MTQTVAHDIAGHQQLQAEQDRLAELLAEPAVVTGLAAESPPHPGRLNPAEARPQTAGAPLPAGEATRSPCRTYWAPGGSPAWAVRMKRASVTAGRAAGRGSPRTRRAASGAGHPAAARGGAVPSARDGQMAGNVGHFGLLLAVLVSVYVLSAFTATDWIRFVQFAFFLVVALLAVRTSQAPSRIVHVAVAVVLGGSVIAVVLSLTGPTGPGAGVASVWMVLLLLLAVVIIVRRVLAAREVTLQSIFGAISAYMIIGLMFAAAYSAISGFGGGAFFADGQLGNVKTFQYFSFVTLTTVGYGDFTAAASGGRAVAVMEALIGQIFLATLVARLVAAYRGPRRPGDAERDRRPRTGSRHVPSATNGSASTTPYRRLLARPRSPARDATAAPGTSRASNIAASSRRGRA